MHFPREISSLPRGSPVFLPLFPMKNILCFILIATFSCDNSGNTPAVASFPPEENASLFAYEGRVPLDEKRHLYIELSISEARQTGEGSFRLEEFLEEDNKRSPVASCVGNYSTLFGSNPEERLLQLHNTGHPKPLKRKYLSHGSGGSRTSSNTRMIREEPFRGTDLALGIEGNNRLIVLNRDLQPVSLEREHNLIKRTSRIFTIEGYFRHNGDSADFHELNTEDTWAVTKFGDYQTAIRQYYQLTQRKFQVTYMKAIGFSISHIDKQGREVEALVIKKVLQMTSTPHEFPPPKARRPKDL